MTDGRPRVVVCGGGITGLAAAYRVAKSAAGRVRVTVMEASSRFGGSLYTKRAGGLVIDGGLTMRIA